jgi:hypothetical protein
VDTGYGRKIPGEGTTNEYVGGPIDHVTPSVEYADTFDPKFVRAENTPLP